MKVYCNILDGVLNLEDNAYLNADLAIFGFNFIGKINYKNELSGTEDKLFKITKLTKNCKKVLIGGAFTDNYGVIRKSSLIAENGKILGIADMHLKRQDLSMSIGFGYKIYPTKMGKIGLLVDQDIFDFDAIKCMAMCDADLIVIVTDKFDKQNLDFLIRSYSLLFGINIILLTPNSIIATNQKGELLTSENQTKVDLTLSTNKTYSLVTTKRRGLIKQ